MPLDARAKDFLGSGPVRELSAQVSKDAETRIQEFRKKEFLERAGSFAEDLVAFFVQQRKKYDFLDDECVAAVALFTINLRESYGSPQNDDEKKDWTSEKRDEKLGTFDIICEQMQNYYDENA